MAGNDVRIVITADDKASGTFKQIGTNAGKLETTLGKVGTIAGGIVLGQGLLRAPGVFADMAQAAADDEAATLRLQTAVRNLGGDYDKNITSVNNAVTAGMKLAFTDDDLRDSYVLLSAATGDHEEALKRQKVAMDLARGAGIPLQQASKLLGKVTEENVEQFKRLGITIGEGATEAEAMGAVQAKFAGQADAFANSTAGQFEKSKIQMGELKEQIGTALLPVMASLSSLLVEKVIPAITGLVNFMKEHETVFTVTAAAIGGVLVVAFAAWAVSAAAAAVATIAAAAPVIAIGLAIGLLVAGIYLLVTHWDDLTAKYPPLKAASDAVKAAFEVFAGWITGTFVPAVESIATKVAEVVGKVKSVIESVWSTIEPMIMLYVAAWKLIIETFWKQIQTMFEMYVGIIKGVIDVFMGIFTGDWDRAWGGIKQIVFSAWEGIKGTVSNAIELIKGMAPLMLEAASAIGNAMRDGIVGGIKGTMGVIGDLGEALLGALKSLINSAIDSVNNAIPNSLSFSVMGKDIGVDLPDNPIPHLASGGIVKARPGGTLALLGEGGRDEAVIPLGGGHKLGGITVNVFANAVGMTADDLAGAVMTSLQRQMA